MFLFTQFWRLIISLLILTPNLFLGRRNTFHVYTLGAIPIFGSLPYLINQCVTDPTGPLAPMYLAAFCGSTVAAISIMGGVFAVLPAYEVGFIYVLTRLKDLWK